MKKIALFSGMVLTLMLAAGVVFGEFTIFIPWFVNDATGTYESNYDTWITYRNVTNSTITVTMDFYDNDEWGVIATTVTVELVPLATTTFYSGELAGATADNSRDTQGFIAGCDECTRYKKYGRKSRR